MNRSIGRSAAVCISLFVMSSSSFAHVEDPKAFHHEPAYVGAGWRSGEGAPRDGSPQFDASGIECKSWVTIDDFATLAGRADDCWGYVSGSGREYAIMGVQNAITFTEITDPTMPEIVATFVAPFSIWHDVKTYQTYAYAVSEGDSGVPGGGIKVFDLSNIDAATDRITELASVTTGGSEDSHNVVIDEVSGYLYRCGGETGIGLRIYDLSNPASPTWVADWPDRYVHDAQIVTYTSGPYAGRQIGFLCSGFGNGSEETGLDIVDLTDKQNIINVSRRVFYDAGYSHQAWLSDDRKYLFLNDELDERDIPAVTTTTTIVFDVSDLDNPIHVKNFTNGNAAIGHNVYFHEGFLYEANYRSGVRIFNVMDPFKAYETGYFDSYPGSDSASFSGNWSVYPYFPSGTIIISDIQSGLFVLDPTVAISTLKFEFPNGLPQLVDPAGGTKVQVQVTGVGNEVPAAGTGEFHYDIGGGLVTVPMASIGPDLYEATFPAVSCVRHVQFHFTAESTDLDSYSWPTTSPSQPIVVPAQVAAAESSSVMFTDSFDIDSGLWTISGDATDGHWELGVPAGDADRGDPINDYDGSTSCYLTDNVAGNSDVDSGTTTLTSPLFDLSLGGEIAYAYWLHDNLANVIGVEDTMVVEVATDAGSTNWAAVRTYTEALGHWRSDQIRVGPGGDVAESDTVRVRVSVSDLSPGSIVEGAFDAFQVTSYDCTPCPPADGDVNLDGQTNALDMQLFVDGALGSPSGDVLCRGDFSGDSQLDADDVAGFVAALLAP